MRIYDFVSSQAVINIINLTLVEDLGRGDVTDITTSLVIPQDVSARARLLAKDDFILAGIEVFGASFQCLDGGIEFSLFKHDGEECRSGDVLAVLEGSLAGILGAERTALNFLQRMSGIATLTAAFVKELQGTHAHILDTRKSVPGLRVLDKYAVRVGGGLNHRFGLYDGILIKDNHIMAAGSVTEALLRAKKKAPQGMKIEVEVGSIEELAEAINIGADVVMLDNMSVEEMREAVIFNQGRVLLEASGNISLANVRMVAETGVDFISIGALTHSVKAADVSLLVVGAKR